MEPSSLVHGAYYWLRIETGEISPNIKVGRLYIGQCILYGLNEIAFNLCGDDMLFPAHVFVVLEMIEYKGNK